jgi:hypothetical protein
VELLAVVVANAVPVSVALAVAFWEWRAQDDFFDALVTSSGHAPRATAPLHDGLGLDEIMVSTKDWQPAARALSQPITDQQLDEKR